ncbi:lytic transglycosylase domain-containing protein [Kiritimatiellaeota bacterium B1221]|nr:lytic transglycosylase domain-containing protein [Kiritimatiellaeota bacterium B1221]
MKHLNWQHDSSHDNRPTGVIAVVTGTILAVAVLLWILDPFSKKPPQDAIHPREITVFQAREPEDSFDVNLATEKLLDAIIQIESHGDPQMVGGVGERGLMQIRESTWKEVTEKHFDEKIPFDRAFEPELNRKVGRYYLGDLQVYLYAHRAKWKSDLRSLLLASYNAGPDRVRKSGFNLKRLPTTVQSYAERGSALHDWYLSESAESLQKRLKEAANPGDQE